MFWSFLIGVDLFTYLNLLPTFKRVDEFEDFVFFSSGKFLGILYSFLIIFLLFASHTTSGLFEPSYF